MNVKAGMSSNKSNEGRPKCLISNCKCNNKSGTGSYGLRGLVRSKVQVTIEVKSPN